MNIDNEKAFEFMKSIEHVYWQYRAFLKTIKSYKDDSALVSKLSKTEHTTKARREAFIK